MDQQRITKTFIACSSHGYVMADRETGVVTEVQPLRPGTALDPEEHEGFVGLQHIQRFDVEEWRRTYPDQTLDSVDILDLGWHMKDGAYIEPEHEWRDMFPGHAGNQPGKVDCHIVKIFSDSPDNPQGEHGNHK